MINFRFLLKLFVSAALVSMSQSADAAKLVEIDPTSTHWIIMPAEAAIPEPRPHLQPFPGGSAVPKLPIVIDQGTRYSVAILNTVGPPLDPEANPEDTEHPPERVLAMRVLDRVDTNVKDKIELALADKNNLNELRVDIESSDPKRYVAFDVKFDWDYELPPSVGGLDSHFLIHFQGLQFGMGAPPFSIRVAGNSTDSMGPINLKFHRRSAFGDEILPDSLDALPREKWLRFILQLIPGHMNSTTSPQIALWYWNLDDDGFDPTDPYTHKWTGPWGFLPNPTIPGSNLIQYSMGMYRRSQPRTQAIQLRNIRYGHNYADVLP